MAWIWSTALAVMTVVVSLLPVAPETRQTANPWIGTWAYDAKASTPTANTYRFRHIVIAQAGSALAFTIEEALVDGPETRWGFTTKGDGSSSAVSGIPAMDNVTATIDGASGMFEYRKGAAPMSTSRVEISGDGRVLTISSWRTMSDGTTVRARTVYARQ